MTLFTDRVNMINSPLFDAVFIKDPPKPGSLEFVDGKYEMKVDAMGLSTYERTLFVDTDTFFLSSVRGLFKLLDWFDMALLAKTAQADIRSPSEPYDIVEGLTPYNTGIILYEKNQWTEHFFDVWSRYYRSLRPILRSTNDQAYFAAAVATEHIKIQSMPNNYNFRVNAPQGMRNSICVLHMAGSKGLSVEEYEVIGKEVNRELGDRCWDPWRRKIIVR